MAVPLSFKRNRPLTDDFCTTQKYLVVKEKYLNFNIYYHISDMIPVALPPRVAGAGLTRSLFVP